APGRTAWTSRALSDVGWVQTQHLPPHSAPATHRWVWTQPTSLRLRRLPRLHVGEMIQQLSARALTGQRFHDHREGRRPDVVEGRPPVDPGLERHPLTGRIEGGRDPPSTPPRVAAVPADPRQVHRVEAVQAEGGPDAVDAQALVAEPRRDRVGPQ